MASCGLRFYASRVDILISFFMIILMGENIPRVSLKVYIAVTLFVLCLFLSLSELLLVGRKRKDEKSKPYIYIRFIYIYIYI